MATIIDIFSITPGEYDACKFIVDNSLDYVTLNTGYIEVIAGNLTAGGAIYLNGGDNFSLLSLGVAIPELYKTSQITSQNGISSFAASFNQTSALPKFHQSELPFGNYELSIGNMIQNNGISGTPEKIYVHVDIKISMQNVPDSENGKEYFIKPFLKIAHSEGLIA